MGNLIVRSRHRSWLFLMLLGLTVVIFAACADSEDSPDPTATTAPAAPTATTTAAAEPTAMTDDPDPTAMADDPDPTAMSDDPDPTAMADDPDPTAMTDDPDPTAMTDDPDSDQTPLSIDVYSDSEMGDILVGSNGLTLYIFDRDTESVSNCSGGCLSAWPPFIVENQPVAGDGVLATISTITLADGTMQVTVNGFPAYYWQGDSAEGDTNGHGVSNVWWVFNADGTPQRPAKIGIANDADMGDILVDGAGRTLYIFDRDTEGVSNCSGGCLNAWPPLLTSYGSVAVGDVTATISTTALADGTQQVTINGFPAYYWQGDSAEGDTNGHGVNNVWWVFKADGTPQRPAKVGTADHSTLGTILVDGAGLTLYLFDNDTAGVSNCSGGCLANWPALLTDYSPVAIGDVTAAVGTITRDDGTMQVTVDEMPVYYWVNDAVPGDTGGQAIGSVWWVLRANGSAIRN